MTSRFEFTPVVILGAGRSGTNALRDTLTSLPGFETWDCDEINAIWRYGNLSWPNDALPPSRATPKVKNFIRSAFLKLWLKKAKPRYVVEKTCANTLRVPFVETVLPEAVYIHIVRDGRDVLASAQKRWRGDLELPNFSYFWAKARNTPLRNLPYYGLFFLKSRLGMLLGRSDRLAVWGPRFPGVEDMGDASLEELCIRQWVACVDAADRGLAEIESKRVRTVRYEDFVRNPHNTIESLLSSLDVTVSPDLIKHATVRIRTDSVGKGRGTLPNPSNHLEQLMGDTLRRHAYGA